MAKGEFLGELEQVVLLALARLEDQAYGVSVRQEIERLTARDVSIGALYSALDRLERKGFVSSRMGAPTRERGGRAKRFFRLEVWIPLVAEEFHLRQDLIAKLLRNQLTLLELMDSAGFRLLVDISRYDHGNEKFALLVQMEKPALLKRCSV